MLQSNQPYQRVDDGVGAGFVAGSVVGAAAGGAAHRWGYQGISALKNLNSDIGSGRHDRISAFYSGEKQKSMLDKVDRTEIRNEAALNKVDKLHAKTMRGGLKGMAAGYAGSILAGGVIGAGVDALNK